MKTKNTTITEDMYKNYKFNPLTVKDFDGRIHDFLYHEESYRHYDVVCTRCGTRFEFDWNGGEPGIKCPGCDNSREHVTDKDLVAEKNVTVLWYENTNLPDNSLAVHEGTVEMRHPKVKGRFIQVYPPEPTGIIKRIDFHTDIFLGKKNVAYSFGSKLRGDAKTFLYDTLICHQIEASKTPIVCAQSDDELKTILANSYFKDSGAAVAMGLSPDKPGVFTKCSLGYFIAWYVNHNIDCLYEEGLFQAMLDIAVYATKKMPGKNAQEILELNDMGFAIAKEINASLGNIKHIRRMTSCDETLTLAGYQTLSDFASLPQVSALFEYNIPHDAIIPYVEKQCAQFTNLFKRKTLEMWNDYLLMAKKLGYDMTLDTTLYPADIEEAVLVAQHRMKRKFN